jgi:Uncharacterized protein conserved in bacteria
MEMDTKPAGAMKSAQHSLAMIMIGCLSAALLPQSVAGQEAKPVQISRLRGELADRFQLNPDDLQLNVPPTVSVFPGAIVCVDGERGIEIVDRLAEQAAAISEAAGDGELIDRAEVREGMSLLKGLLGGRTSLPTRAGVQVAVRDIRRLSLKEQDPKRLAAATSMSRSAIAAFRQKRKPMLIHEVFVGKLTFEIQMDPIEGAQFQAAIEGFRLEQSEPGLLRISSDKDMPFAFRASILNFRSIDIDPSEMSLEPATTTRATASPWELAERPFAAAANGHRDEDGHEVTVLYATCRAVEAVLPTIAALMTGFVLTANGLFTVAIIVIVLLVGAIALGLMKRLNLLGLAAAFALGLAVFLGIAWVDAKRQQSLSAKVTGVYGNKRGELRYGLSKVSVPKQRQRGEFNTPFAFYVIQLPEDPEKHFVVTELQENRDAFFRELKDKVAASSERNAFVFIHGYNVPFADAVKRTAQLTVDLQFAGAPICYSWPSQGDLTEYVQDSTNAEVAAYKLKQLLQDLNAESGAKEIHLVAHSMGNDVLTRALKELGKEALGKPDCVFREVLLTAPDIDTELFETEILPAFLSSKQRITLYASSNDKALNASFKLRGSPRAGLAGQYLLVAKGVETIDVSALDTGFLGHAYYGDHPLVVGDMLSVLCKHLPPGERGLHERAKGGLTYWEFVR